MIRPVQHRGVSGWTTLIVIALLASLSGLLVPAPAGAARAPAAAPPITVPFDHLPTGFELDGVHRDLVDAGRGDVCDAVASALAPVASAGPRAGAIALPSLGPGTGLTRL